MSESNPLQQEVSRILHSQAPTQLVSQLKYLNSYEARVEQELRTKSQQIAKLQNYLKDQITNIQAIVTQNNSLKKENQLLRNALNARTQQQEETAKEVQMLTQLNKESSLIIRRLEDQLQQLETVNAAPPPPLIDVCSQTDPVVNAVPSLLDRIGSLEELVMQLKFEKNQLQQRLSCQDNCSSSAGQAHHENQTSIEERRITTGTVLEMVAEGQLREVRFRGEMLEGLKQGRGVCEYHDGIVYDGDFHQGRRHGQGTLLIEGQVLYRGCWRDNFIEGKGRIAMLEGEIQSYEGHFVQGRLEGYGCMKLKSGKRITALWKDGKIVGNCLEVCSTSKRYRKPELIECY